MQANEVRFAVSPAPGGKRLVGIFDGIFDNDGQIAEYMREQARALLKYADGIDRYTARQHAETAGKVSQNGVEVDPVTRRVVELARLTDGWLDGEGVAPDSDGLAWLNFSLHTRHLNLGLPQPHIYPSQDGSVGCEWSISNYECEIEVDLKRHVGTWTVVDMEGDSPTEERELDLDDADSWAWVNDRIRLLAAA